MATAITAPAQTVPTLSVAAADARPGGVAQVQQPVQRDEPVDTAEVRRPRAHGVVRLLAEGHFKAKAAARLAENHAEELAARGIDLDADEAQGDDQTPGDPRLSRIDVVA